MCDIEKALQMRVQRGSGVLDKEYPSWAKAINTDMLDLSNGKWCILGQLYGHVLPGLAELFYTDPHDKARLRTGFVTKLSHDPMRILHQHGFDDWYSHDRNLEELQALWIKEISFRRKVNVEESELV